MVEHCHGVDFLQQEAFELGILDHLPLRNALDGIVGGGGGGLGGQQHVSESALAQPSNGVELVTV